MYTTGIQTLRFRNVLCRPDVQGGDLHVADINSTFGLVSFLARITA